MYQVQNQAGTPLCRQRDIVAVQKHSFIIARVQYTGGKSQQRYPKTNKGGKKTESGQNILLGLQGRCWNADNKVRDEQKERNYRLTTLREGKTVNHRCNTFGQVIQELTINIKQEIQAT